MDNGGDKRALSRFIRLVSCTDVVINVVRNRVCVVTIEGICGT